MATSSSEEDFEAGRVCMNNVKIAHKYAEPLDMDITLGLGGACRALCLLTSWVFY